MLEMSGMMREGCGCVGSVVCMLDGTRDKRANWSWGEIGVKRNWSLT